MTHQKHLILGISGEIRNRLVVYRSKQETGEDYFPRIESARDNLGNVWIPGQLNGGMLHTKKNLRPGDNLEFIITASDPLGEELEYSIRVHDNHATEWQKNNIFRVKIEEEHISRNFGILIAIKSKRDYHASQYSDDSIWFYYTVLPRKK